LVHNPNQIAAPVQAAQCKEVLQWKIWRCYSDYWL